MVSKFVDDIKYFFDRLFDREGKPLLMLSIIGCVMAVLEIIIFLFIIRNASKLNIPFLVIYLYFLYFVNRFIIRGIQFLLIRFNVIKYQEDNYLYSEDDTNNRIRRYNASVYIKERDRYEATVVYIVTLVLFLLVILIFALSANKIVTFVLCALIFFPFIIFLKEPYEIISVDVNEQDKRDMTKKDFVEEFLDQIFKEKQITSLLELPGEAETPQEFQNQQNYQQPPEYTEQQYYAQEQQYYNQLNQEQYEQYEQANQVVDYPQYQNTYAQQNPGDINQQIDNQEITGQWWQQQ